MSGKSELDADRQDIGLVLFRLGFLGVRRKI